MQKALIEKLAQQARMVLDFSILWFPSEYDARSASSIAPVVVRDSAFIAIGYSRTTRKRTSPTWW